MVATIAAAVGSGQLAFTPVELFGLDEEESETS